MTDSRESCPDGWDPAELLAYLEGDMNPADARKLDEHLRTCVVCSAELGSLRKLDQLLKNYPESFHPAKKELYRLASTGEDATGQIEAHIQSCPDCKEELDLLLEMIALRKSGEVAPIELPPALVHEFGRSHGSQVLVEGPGGRLSSWLRRLLEIPTSVPILTLGTAAAVLVITVFAVPLWKTYIEKAPNLGVIPETVAPAQKPAELSSGIQEAAPRAGGAPPHGVEDLRKYSVPRTKEEEQTPGAGRRPIEESRELAKSNQSPMLKGRMSEDAPAAVSQPPQETALPAAAPVQAPKREPESRAYPSAPVLGKQLRSRGDRDKVSRTSEADEKKQPEKEIRTAEPVNGLADATARIPVEVRIIDSQGRDLDGITFVPPADNLHVFIRGTLERKKEKAPAKPRPAASKDRKTGERIVIKVTGEGGTRDLEGQLFSGDSVTPEKTVKVESVDKDDLTRSIQDLVSSLTAAGSDVQEPDRPGN